MLMVRFVLALSLSTFASQQPAKPDQQAVVVLTGCLRSDAADPAIAGPEGRIYTLEVMDAAGEVAGTSTTAASPQPASKTTYSLAAAPAIGLAKHVGHEVQLSGTLRVPAATASPSRDAQAKPARGGGHRTLNVTSLKMVAQKCS
jgi:hypothetical protein